MTIRAAVSRGRNGRVGPAGAGERSPGSPAPAGPSLAPSACTIAGRDTMDEILDDTLDLLQAGRGSPWSRSSPTRARRRAPPGRRCSCARTARSRADRRRAAGAHDDAGGRGRARERRSRRARADLDGADLTSGEKMVCGGAAEVLITYVPPGDAELLVVCAALREARDAGRRAWYVTLLPVTGDAVEHCLLDEDGRHSRLRGVRGGGAARPRQPPPAPRLRRAPGRPHRRARARRSAGARRHLRRRPRRRGRRAAPRLPRLPRGRGRRP